MHDGPAVGIKVIAPSDSNLFEATRAIYVGTGGDLNVQMFDGTTAIIPAMPTGMYPISVVKVLATSTTAAGIRGFY
ncbi:hypothetical protein SAMN04487969_10642 [Paenibacillus algorifonticola]|uniref:Uncharacterized protein n=1 Tax=Paenibacillus algorifonticola TaxID=684063 RepID=A0A1I2D1A1_9BACL|nr:hypothetical protein [Paenibacillus algorifonticola]SFE74347.1 hypothetical protein SAMN04487969_10642 [Paenibacillus algorifonticola]